MIPQYHTFKPSKFEWHHGDCDYSDVTAYFDLDHMGGFNNNGSGLKFLRDNFNNSKDGLKFLLGGFEKNKDRLKFLMSGFNNHNKDKLKFLWLSESRAITGKVYNHVLENADLFFGSYDAIFVHDREIIETDKRFTFAPISTKNLFFLLGNNLSIIHLSCPN